MNANQTTTTATTKREETKNRLNDLISKRNALVNALEISTDIFKPQFDEIVTELCETVAQIATYKTLLKLSDGAKDITQSGADMCQNMLYSFPLDMHIYRTGDLTAIYSDAMDIYHTAYFEIWQVLKNTVPLSLDDTVYTRALKNGDEKNYTVFQLACKSIREYIHTWSKSQDFKKLHYVIGFTDNGEQVTTSKRPQDDLHDITDNDRKKLFKKYGLTAQQQDIISLIINGEKADTISTLLNIPLRTVQDNIKKAKAKFTTASAYAEYITAKNAEKIAKAKAEKSKKWLITYEEDGQIFIYSKYNSLDEMHEELQAISNYGYKNLKTLCEYDRLYWSIYEKAQDRTAKALAEWKTAFYKEMKKDI